ncbi:InlB B-repeat-containing protein [Adlercreutzia sp. ZJ141]|uniref:InlB B-repeat-containing protein n=1 Tax=Adlercreutzia sp. ZJ141 TaxID=2709406 RepID=UPI0013EA2F37|nr:InlB B-repeat-containing protein [Adlercreutzia sp. ZJ141]
MHTLRAAISLMMACVLVATLAPVAPHAVAFADESESDSSAEICGSCMDESAGDDVESREKEAGANLAEALAQAEEDRARAEAEARSEYDTVREAEAARVDTSLTDRDMLLADDASSNASGNAGGESDASDAGDAPTKRAARRAAVMSLRSAPTYSADITYKDIKSLSVYEMNGDGSVFNVGMLNVNNFNPTDRLAYVECYRIPSFYAEIESANVVDDKFYLKLKLPTAEGEQQRYLDVLWGYVNGSYSRPVSQQVTDETILTSLEQVQGYDSERNNAYINAYKLAPFASLEDIVKSGNAIPADSPLATKTIVESWPVHKDSGMKVSLRSGQVEDVARAVVCFSDGTSQTLDVSYMGTSHLAASYVAAEPEILYQPDFWVLDDGVSGSAIEKVATFIRSKTWKSYFKGFCRNIEVHRTVRDYFDRDMHDNAEEVAANLLSNVGGWCATAPNTKVWDAIMTRSMEAKPETTFTSTIREYKMFDLLFLYTYYERFCGFDTGGSESVGAQKNVNPFLLMAFRGDVIRPGLSLVGMTSDVRYSSVYTFSMTDKTSSGAYSAFLAKRTGAPDVPSFLQMIVQRTTGYADMANWFADYMSSRYFYKEFRPEGAEGVDTSNLVWRGWDQVKRFPDYLLAWVTLDDASQYMGVTAGLLATGTSTGYYAEPALDDEHRAAFEKLMSDAAFSHMAKYAATASTIVGVDKVNATCVVSVDRKWNKNEGTAYLEREKLWGKTLTEDDYCKNFTDAIGLYNSSAMGSAVMTLNMGVNYKRLFFFSGALELGWSIWSHEMGHALDNDWFLQGGTRRAGTEDYTDGLLTQGFGQYSYSMNLTYDYDLSADVATNLTRGRISSTEKLSSYYGNMYDALDVLDYAALKAFLRLEKDEQNAVASQAQYDGQNGSSPLDVGATATILRSRNAVLSDYKGTAATAPVNLSAFVDGTREFTTVEEVYDNQIFLRPKISDTGKVSWLWDLYVQEDIQGVWWHPIHANGSHPDSRSFKLQMYRMLGDYGYDAFVEFGSGSEGDVAKLQRITGFDSFKEYQLAKWDAIEKDASKLEYVAFDDLVSKFEEALKTDASKADRNLSQMSALRTRMYYLMKRMTNDFTYGIYDNQAPVTFIHNLDELRAIKNNPYGNYALANDIDTSAFEGADDQALVEGAFYGKLDGRGHAIYADGRVLPNLFTSTKNAYVKDVTLRGGVSAKPATVSINSEFEKIQYDLYAEKIYTIKDFVNIANASSETTRFMLMNDLDFSGWQPATAGGSVVAGVFGGTNNSYKEFNGNGHKITGLKDASLFDKVCWANIHDLVITGSSNMQDAASGSGVSLVAKASAASQFSDIFFENVSLRGKDRIGFVSGSDGFINYQGKVQETYGSQFDRIQVMGGTIENGTKNGGAQNQTCYVGFVTGRALNSDFNDVYVQGTLTTYGTSCGGVVGAIQQSSRLNRCISNVDINRKFNYGYTENEITRIGCLLGDIESIGDSAKYGETLISSCFGLGNPAKNVNLACGRLAWSNPTVGAAAKEKFSNCFENGYVTVGASLAGSGGVTWVNTGDRFRAWKVPKPTYDVPDLRNNKEFYTNLGFSEDVWDFDTTIPVGYPVLRIVDESSIAFDVDISVDYKNEKILLSGADYSADKTYIKNLPMYHNEYKEVIDVPTDTLLSDWNKFSIHATNDNEMDLAETIEFDIFGETREVTFKQYPIDSGKAVVYEASVAVPPRFDNPYAGSIAGIEAEESGGMGAISIDVATLQGAAGGFEYQRVPDDLLQHETKSADGSHTIIPSSQFPRDKWVAITSATTNVEPGTYAVRLGSYEKSFASNPVIITVGDYDASAVRAAIEFNVNGGEWINEANVPAHYVQGKKLILPGPETMRRNGYSFIGWYAQADFSGEPLLEISEEETGAVALYARWSAEEYPVELVLNGGYFESSEENVLSYRYGAETPLPVSPLREGYTFAGWYDNESFTGDPVECITASDQGAKRFYAKWDITPCKITYHLGSGGAGKPAFAAGVDTAKYASYVPGQTFMLPTASDLVWEGYTFEGWFDNEACEGVPIAEILADDTGDKEFFAKWEKDVYVITYVTEGGVFEQEPQRVYHVEDGFAVGSIIELPTADNIKKDKYVFEGWYKKADYTDEALESIALDEPNVTLYAKWRLNCFDVTLHANGGTFAEGVDDRFAYEGGESIDLPKAEEVHREGYVFDGWYDNMECTGVSISSITASDRGDKQLWAKWKPNSYSVTLHVNEGVLADGVSSSWIYHVGAGAVLPKADEITRKGHDFRGWFDNAECVGSPVLHVSPTDIGNKSFWAKWEPSVYGVTLEYNGGALVTGQVNVTEYVYGKGAVLPTLERDGYEFLGWYDNPECAGYSVFAIDGDSVGEKAFYAGWKTLEVDDPVPDDPSMKPEDPPITPDVPPTTSDVPPAAPDNPNTSGTPGSASGGGNLGSGDGQANGDAAHAGSAAPSQAGGKNQLAPTGDRLLISSATLAALALTSACVVVALRRIARKRR